MLRCQVAGVAAVEAETRHSFPRHTHGQFGIGVIDRGAQKSLSGRGTVEAVAGDTITVNPGEVHDGVPIGDAGRSWRMLYFDPPLIAEPVADLSDGTWSSFEFTRPAMTDTAVARTFRHLFSAMTARDPSAIRHEELLLLLLAGVMRERVDHDGLRKASDAIGRARNLIDDEPARPTTLADLARESGLSRFQVLRGFVRATGFTPHAYLVQRRIDLARRLIAGGTPLAQAAAASGFADQSHMTRVFVRTYGVSPGAYADAMA